MNACALALDMRTLAANCNACPTHRKSDLSLLQAWHTPRANEHHFLHFLGSCRRQAQLQRSARTPVAFSDTSDSDDFQRIRGPKASWQPSQAAIVTDDALFGVTFSPTC